MRALLLVVLAGCKVAAMTEPKLEPVIGTRMEGDGKLTPRTEITEPFGGYIGCDLIFDGVPDGTEITLVWVFEPEKFTTPATVIHQAWYRIYDGDRTPKRAYVDLVSDPTTHGNALGAYECLWTMGTRGVSRRLYVRAAVRET